MPKIVKQSPRSVKKSGVLSRITPLGKPNRGLKLSLYGRSGSGKTTFWATFPKPILAVICSGGTDSGELLSIDTPANRKVIKQVEIKSSDEITEITDYCKENPNEFKTLILDHATGLQDLVVMEVGGLKDTPLQMSWGIISQQQWGQVALHMKERFRSLLDLPQNVVIVAQEREFNTDNESSLLMPYVGSALSPSTAGWLNSACDYICQTFIRPKMVEKEVKMAGQTRRVKEATGEFEYGLRTGPHDVYTTKFRKPKGGDPLPDVIIDPSYPKLAKLLGK